MTEAIEAAKDQPPKLKKGREGRGDFIATKELPPGSHVFFFITTSPAKRDLAIKIGQGKGLYPILKFYTGPELSRETGKVRESDKVATLAAWAAKKMRFKLPPIKPMVSLEEFAVTQAEIKVLNMPPWEINKIFPSLLVATDVAGEIVGHEEIELKKHLSFQQKKQALGKMQGGTIRIATGVALAHWAQEEKPVELLEERVISLEVDIRPMSEEEIKRYLLLDVTGKHEADQSGLGAINLLGERCKGMRLIREIRHREPDDQLSRLSLREAEGIILGYPHQTIKEMLNEHFPSGFGFTNKELAFAYFGQPPFHPDLFPPSQ